MARDGRTVKLSTKHTQIWIILAFFLNFTQYWVSQSKDMGGRLSVIACLAGVTSCLVVFMQLVSSIKMNLPYNN